MTNPTDIQTTEAAMATAEWWAGKVFGGAVGAIDRPGSSDPHTGAAMMLGLLAGAQGVPAAASKRDQFITRLARYVDGILTQDRAEKYGVTLSTDYGPEGELARLADDLRLGGSFPWKTITWTYPTHLVTALGYGAPGQVSWHAEGWTPPPCNQQQWDLSTPRGGRLPWRCSAPKYHAPDAHVFDVPDPLCVTCGRSVSDEKHSADYWGTPHDFRATA